MLQKVHRMQHHRPSWLLLAANLYLEREAIPSAKCKEWRQGSIYQPSHHGQTHCLFQVPCTQNYCRDDQSVRLERHLDRSAERTRHFECLSFPIIVGRKKNMRVNRCDGNDTYAWKWQLTDNGSMIMFSIFR